MNVRATVWFVLTLTVVFTVAGLIGVSEPSVEETVYCEMLP